MLRYLLLLLCLAPAHRIAAAQESPKQDSVSLTVEIRTSPLGNAAVSFSSESPELITHATHALNCQWQQVEKSTHYSAGMCRALLLPDPSLEAVLNLAPVVETALKRGAERVSLTVRASQRRLLPPPGWEAGASNAEIKFTATNRAVIPAPVAIQLKSAPSLNLPLIVVLLAPFLFAYGIRQGADGASDAWKQSWIVWMNWIHLSLCIYWLGAISPNALSDLLLLKLAVTGIFTLIAAFLIYLLPLLLSAAACLRAIVPLLSPEKDSLSIVFRRHLLAQTGVLLPLAIFFSSLCSDGYIIPAVSLLLAIALHRLLSWWCWNLSFSGSSPVQSGDLLERAAALSRRASLQPVQLAVLHTRVPEQWNAFSMPRNVVALTDTMIDGLKPRELDALLAMEIGNHADRRFRSDSLQILFLPCLLVAGPGLGWLCARFNIPFWVSTIPIFPLVFLVLQQFLAARGDVESDARAARLTSDAEGIIAALGRVVQHSRVPLDGLGVLPSFLGGPSLERRVHALAHRYGVPDWRALAILRNPDEVYRKVGAKQGNGSKDRVQGRATLKLDPVFSARARSTLAERSRWALCLSALFGATLLGILADAALRHFGLKNTPLVAAPAVALATLLLTALCVAAQVLLDTAFVETLRWKLAKLLYPDPEFLFAGIHPGAGVRYTDGFPDWDFGYFSVESGWLVFRGENTSFAIPRRYIMEISLVQGPKRWMTEHRVEVLFRGGAFTMNTEFANSTRKTAAQTRNWLNKWVASSGDDDALFVPPPEPPPILPQLPGTNGSRRGPIWQAAISTFIIWVAAPFLVKIPQGSWQFSLSFLLVMVAAPLAVMLSLLPAIIWPVRSATPTRPEELPEPPHMEALIEPETHDEFSPSPPRF